MTYEPAAAEDASRPEAWVAGPPDERNERHRALPGRVCHWPRLGSRALVALVVLFAGAASPSQDTPWLQPVARVKATAKDTKALAMTGDGNHILVTGSDGVMVLPVDGGAPWRVPEIGAGAKAVPFGAAANLCAVDGRSLVLVDAKTRVVARRLPLDALGRDREPTCLAVRPDGKQVVLAARAPKAADAGWLLDLDTGAHTPTPVAPVLAAWVHDGFALLNGRPGTCGVLLDATWTWLPATPVRGDAAPARNPSRVWVEFAAAIAPVPGRHELVHPHFVEDQENACLGRFDPSTGALLASHATDGILISPVLAVAGHIVSVDQLERRLELRRFDDLRVCASVAWLRPDDLPLAATLAAAEHAKRLVCWRDGALAVYEIIPPPAK